MMITMMMMEKFDDVFRRFHTIPAWQMDRRTNRQISCDRIVRAMHAHRTAMKFN